ncbi:MAG: hypothetical protein AAFO77_10750 [Pseudomonadota bacterium]
MHPASTPEAILQANIESIIRLVMGMGVHVSVGADFDEFVRLCRRTPGKNEVSPAFNPQLSDINSSNGIWMTGHRGKEMIYAQAIRLLPLDGDTLEAYLERALGDIRIGGMDVDVANSPVDLSEPAAAVRGSVTYHGEVWMKPGSRGTALTILLGRLILIMAYLRWKPDYLIGIQPFKVCCRGLGVRQGYARNHPGFVKWAIRGRANPIEGWLVWMDREEALASLSVPPVRFYEEFEKQEEAAPRTAMGAR